MLYKYVLSIMYKALDMVLILIDLNRLANIIAMPHTFVFKRYINLGLYRFMEVLP